MLTILKSGFFPQIPQKKIRIPPFRDGQKHIHFKNNLYETSQSEVFRHPDKPRF